MGLQKHARNLLYYDLMCSRRTEQAPYPKLSELAPLWLEARNDPKSPPKEFLKGTVTSIIKDASVDFAQQTLTLLIEVSDKNAPNATYLDHAKRMGRHIDKAEPEGNGQAAHVIVSLVEETGKALRNVPPYSVCAVPRLTSQIDARRAETCLRLYP